MESRKMMKYYLDTNVAIEYFLERENYELVLPIIYMMKQQKGAGSISAGSFCSVPYILDKKLKDRISTKKERADKIRDLYFSLREYISIATLTEEIVDTAYADERFIDIEDAVQYHCAIAAGCSYLITFNVKDFPDVGEIKIIHPSEFGKE